MSLESSTSSMTASPTGSINDENKENPKARRLVDIAGLGITIVAVWILFALPFILFYFPKDIANTESQPDSSNVTLRNETAGMPCRQKFFYDEVTGVCRPECKFWIQSSQSAAGVIMSIALFLSNVAAVLFLVISFSRFKEIVTFPFVFAIYITFDLLVLEMLPIIMQLQPSLLCTSRDFQTNIVKGSPFCVISGIIFIYTLFQIGCWWFFHVAAFFWTVLCPINAFLARKLNRIKHIHIGCVIAGFLLPLLPLVIIVADYTGRFKTDETLMDENVTFLSGGFGFCGRLNPKATLYGFVLPLSLLTAIGTTLLIFVIYVLHKQQKFSKKQQSKNSVWRRAERILIAAFCYYVVMGVITLTTYARHLGRLDQIEKEAIKYFQCEAGGYNADDPCDKSRYQQILGQNKNFIGYIMLILYPTVHLIYVLNLRGLTEKLKICFAGKQKSKGMTSIMITVP